MIQNRAKLFFKCMWRHSHHVDLNKKIVLGFFMSYNNARHVSGTFLYPPTPPWHFCLIFPNSITVVTVEAYTVILAPTIPCRYHPLLNQSVCVTPVTILYCRDTKDDIYTTYLTMFLDGTRGIVFAVSINQGVSMVIHKHSSFKTLYQTMSWKHVDWRAPKPLRNIVILSIRCSSIKIFYHANTTQHYKIIIQLCHCRRTCSTNS